MKSHLQNRKPEEQSFDACYSSFYHQMAIANTIWKTSNEWKFETSVIINSHLSFQTCSTLYYVEDKLRYFDKQNIIHCKSCGNQNSLVTNFKIYSIVFHRRKKDRPTGSECHEGSYDTKNWYESIQPWLMTIFYL